MQRDVNIDFDLENTALEIKTDSTLGSDEEVAVFFLTDQGDDAGGVGFKFSHSLSYRLYPCTGYVEFPEEVPTETDKVWRITLSRILGLKLVVHCNDVEVLNVMTSDSTCADWASFWTDKVAKISFLSDYDTASDFYRPATASAPVIGKFTCIDVLNIRRLHNIFRDG